MKETLCKLVLLVAGGVLHYGSAVASRGSNLVDNPSTFRSKSWHMDWCHQDQLQTEAICRTHATVGVTVQPSATMSEILEAILASARKQPSARCVNVQGAEISSRLSPYFTMATRHQEHVRGKQKDDGFLMQLWQLQSHVQSALCQTSQLPTEFVTLRLTKKQNELPLTFLPEGNDTVVVVMNEDEQVDCHNRLSQLRSTMPTRTFWAACEHRAEGDEMGQIMQFLTNLYIERMSMVGTDIGQFEGSDQELVAALV